MSSFTASNPLIESASNPADAAPTHRRPTRRRRGLPPAKMQLHLTAMIDVIFQLLVYFVVTASFAVDEGILTASLPTGTGQPADLAPPPMTLDIELASHDDIGVTITVAGTRRDSFTELYAELDSLVYDPDRGRHAGDFAPDDPVVIRPAGDVRWQHVVNAFNAAVRARYTNVNFARPE